MIADELAAYLAENREKIHAAELPAGWRAPDSLPITKRAAVSYLMDDGRIEHAPGVSNTHLLVMPGVVVGWRFK